MAYVFTPPPSMAIRLPKRRWNTRGIGQMTLSADFCTALGITTGWCAQFAPPTPPAFPAPAGPATSDQMTTAGAWTPEESELETQQNTVLQSQNFLQNVVLPGAAVPWRLDCGGVD